MSTIQVDIKNYNPAITTDTAADMNAQAIDNGNFDIWQRGITFTNPATASFTSDRWRVDYVNNGTLPTTIIHTKQTLTAGSIAGSQYYYNISANANGSGFAATDLYTVGQKIENGTAYLAGASRYVTVSFYARCLSTATHIGIFMEQNYGTGGSPSTQEILPGRICNLGPVYTKFTFSFLTNTLVGKTFGTANDDYLSLKFALMYGSTIGTTYVGDTTGKTFTNGNVEIAQVKINEGQTALPFSPRSFQMELAKCQRYCLGITTVAANENIAFGHAITTSTGRYLLYLPVPMRAVPVLSPAATVTDWQVTDFVTYTDTTTLTLGSETSTRVVHINIAVASTPLTQWRPMALCGDATPGRIMILSADL